MAVPRANVEVVGPFGYVGSDADDAGKFVIEGLAPGTHKVRLYHGQRGQGEALELTIAEGADPSPVQLKFAPELVDAVEVDLGAGAAGAFDFEVAGVELVTFAGRVEDAAGAGEVDAVVTVNDGRTRARALTDETGRFAVSVAAGGKYRVTAISRAGASVQQKDVAPGSEVVLKIAATRRVCGAVAVAGEVEGDAEIGRYALREPISPRRGSSQVLRPQSPISRESLRRSMPH